MIGLVVKLLDCDWSISHLSASDGWTQVCLGTVAEDALVTLALWSVARDDDITDLDTGHTISHALHHCCSLVTQNTGEQSLWIMTIQSVDISVTESVADNLEQSALIISSHHQLSSQTSPPQITFTQ